MDIILHLPGVVICQEGSVTHLLLKRTQEIPVGPFLYLTRRPSSAKLDGLNLVLEMNPHESSFGTQCYANWPLIMVLTNLKNSLV